MAYIETIMDALNLKRVNRGRNYVREWRKHRRLTQEQLAEATGYTPSSISQLETGAQGYEEATLVKLAHALECKPGDLISGPPDEIAFVNELRMLEPAERKEVISALNDMLVHIRKLAKR